MLWNLCRCCKKPQEPCCGGGDLTIELPEFGFCGGTEGGCTESSCEDIAGTYILSGPPSENSTRCLWEGTLAGSGCATIVNFEAVLYKTASTDARVFGCTGGTAVAAGDLVILVNPIFTGTCQDSGGGLVQGASGYYYAPGFTCSGATATLCRAFECTCFPPGSSAHCTMPGSVHASVA